MPWTNLLNDSLIAQGVNFSDLHARIDNYQIYSVLILDSTVTEIVTSYTCATALPPGFGTRELSRVDIDQVRYNMLPVLIGNLRYYGVIESRYIYDNDLQDYRYQNFLVEVEEETYPVPTPPTPGTAIDGLPANRIIERTNCIAYQSFSPVDTIAYSLSTLFEPYMSRLFNGNVRIDCEFFASGHPQSSKLLPTSSTFVATSNRIIKWSYYRKNKLENHPKILHTLDYRSGAIIVKIGETYYFPLIDPCLGTLVVDATTRQEISSRIKNGEYPYKYLFSENLQELCDTWDVYYPAIPLPSNLANNFTITQTAQVLPPLTYFTTRITSVFNSYRLMGANNNLWSNGIVVSHVRYPPASHILFVFNFFTLFESIQLDNTYGTYVMDSPRILEIHAALEADKYSTNSTTVGSARVTTLGFLIENLARVMGLRLNDDGLIDKVKEKSRYLPATLSNPIGEVGAYGLTSWGTQGRYLPHLPTTYENSKEVKLYDVVSDLPQMLEAILRQLDKALGIQHGSEIRFTSQTNEVREYPNQLAMSIELFRKIEGIEYIQNVSHNQVTVIGAEVRELFSIIGVPVTQKFINLKSLDGSQDKQLPYFGHQKNKPSVMGDLATVKVNLGIINGVLMPKVQSKKASILNPFKRFAS